MIETCRAIDYFFRYFRGLLSVHSKFLDILINVFLRFSFCKFRFPHLIVTWPFWEGGTGTRFIHGRWWREGFWCCDSFVASINLMFYIGSWYRFIAVKFLSLYF